MEATALVTQINNFINRRSITEVIDFAKELKQSFTNIAEKKREAFNRILHLPAKTNSPDRADLEGQTKQDLQEIFEMDASQHDAISALQLALFNPAQKHKVESSQENWNFNCLELEGQHKYQLEIYDSLNPYAQGRKLDGEQRYHHFTISPRLDGDFDIRIDLATKSTDYESNGRTGVLTKLYQPKTHSLMTNLLHTVSEQTHA